MNYITSKNNYLNFKKRQFGKIKYGITKVVTKIISSHYSYDFEKDMQIIDSMTNLIQGFECVRFNRR